MGQLISDNKTKMSGERMTCKGTLRGHNGWITQIATTPVFPDMLLSASRDKTIIMWQLTREEGQYGIPKRRLNGHSHFVSDVVISSDGQFCLSGSWDGTLRLWDLASGNTTRRFIGRTKDVLSVAFSADNRQIVSAARDRTIKLWNTLGICKYTIQEQGHTEWVSCVRFSPLAQNPVIVSSGWDKLVKVWNLSNCKLKRDYHGHSGYLNTVPVSPMDHSALPVAATVPPSCGIWAARRPSPQHYSWQCPVFLPPRLSRRHPPSEYTSAPWQLESSPKLLKCSQDSWAQWQSPDNSLLGIGLL